MARKEGPVSLVVVPDAVNGLDLCGEIQWPVNAKKIREAGFEYAYVQSSRYSSQKAGRFNELVGQLRDAGLRVGAYHFCSHDSDPVQQARFFHKASNGLGSAAGELPPMADWEHCTPSKYNNHPQHCVSWIAVFLKECKELWYGAGGASRNGPSPRLPVGYSYPDYCGIHQPALAQNLELGGYPLCLASYRQDGAVPAHTESAVLHKIPKPWKTWTLCQYSGNIGQPVPGVSGPCDRQVFNGSSAEFAVFAGISRLHTEGNFEVKEDVFKRK